MTMFRQQYPERMPDDEYRQEHVLLPAEGTVTPDGADITDRIEAICLEFPGYGYRRVTKQLQHDGKVITTRRYCGLMRESDLLCRVRRKWVKTTDSKHPFPRFPNLIKDNGGEPNEPGVAG